MVIRSDWMPSRPVEKVIMLADMGVQGRLELGGQKVFFKMRHYLNGMTMLEAKRESHR